MESRLAGPKYKSLREAMSISRILKIELAYKEFQY